MRKILIDGFVKAVAENYRKEVHSHGHYGRDDNILINPSRRLDALLKAFNERDVTSNDGTPLPQVVAENLQRYTSLLLRKYKDDLLDATPGEIKSLNTEFDNAIGDPAFYYLKVKVRNKKVAKFNDIIIKALRYDDIRQYIYPQYIRRLGIKACVYCNAAFCVTDRNGVAYYTADHWKPKSRYPHLAISFFNLVPCCFSCNRNKGDDEGEYFCLYEDDPHVGRDVLYLRVSAKSMASYIMNHDADELEICLSEATPDYKTLRDNMDERLHITSIYREHIDVAEETIWRKMAYNTSSMEALNQLFSDKGQKLSNEEVRRFIYGTYPDSDDMHKRPLTRLIQNLMD